jgi:uncharacterized NAD(P)/FAD-binding protein YdhS
VAYGTTVRTHLLNVPAGRMSGLADQPSHFLDWALARREALLDPPWVPDVGPSAFLPRRAYGAYLADLLEEAARAAGPGVGLERVEGEAVDIRRTAGGYRIDLGPRGALEAGTVVLALGNFPPGDPVLSDARGLRSPRYLANPWAAGLPGPVLRTDACLLLGSGLTMADWAVSLAEAGYRGRIVVLSRRGLWPQVHEASPAPCVLPGPGERPRTVRGWLRWLRGAADEGGGWRAAVDALRPETPALWSALGETEQRRFLRHARPYWDCHRHRLPPGVAATLETLRASGQLVPRAGRLLACREAPDGLDITLQPRSGGAPEALRVGAIVNCMGSESDYRRLDSPLVRRLLERGLARTDAHGLGLATTGEGRLLGLDGPQSSLFTLGPPRKGQAWETTAVPEIRVQAAALAALLLEGPAGGTWDPEPRLPPVP